MRLLLPFLAIALAGCSTMPNSDISTWQVSQSQTTYVLPDDDGAATAAGAFGEASLYLVALQVNDGTCYVRVRNSLPSGQVCQFGDFIRVSPDAPLATDLAPVPPLVLGLFDTLDAGALAE